MFYFKRNNLTAMLFIINCVIFVLASPFPPQNNYEFGQCIAQMVEIFFHVRNSPLTCIKIAIEKYTDNSQIFLKYPKAKAYYLSFSEETNSEVINDQNTFCDQILKGYAGAEEKEIFKQRCIDETAVFGSTKDQIVEYALYKRIPVNVEHQQEHHGWNYGNFANGYLFHIQDVIVLKENTNLVSLWTYCYNTNSDNKKKHSDSMKHNIKRSPDEYEDQAESSNKKFKNY